MVANSIFRSLVSKFIGVSEAPHFDRIAFKNKRIFVTLHEKSQTANFKFNIELQESFCSFQPDAIEALPNKWGLQGWTTIDLKKIETDVVLAAIEAAYHLSK